VGAAGPGRAGDRGVPLGAAGLVPLVDGPNGPQRLVPLDAVVERAARSPRIQRRAERELSLEAQVTLLRHRIDQLELRLAAVERR
jgi:hypothetical protein